jgi:hypothetical protein
LVSPSLSSSLTPNPSSTPVSALYASYSSSLPVSSANLNILSAVFSKVGSLTPLCVASFAGYDNICTLLILHGARVNLISPSGIIIVFFT